MSSVRKLVCFFLFIGLLFTLSHSAAFQIRNRCPYTVWAAAKPGGGRQLTSGESWTINFNAGITTGRIWGRTNCTFNGTGHGRCQSGDCGGLFQCSSGGSPPSTLAEFALNQFNNLDFYDMSLVDGFNIPMEFSPTTGGCTKLGCTADITGECPNELRAPGGCNNPCTVFNTDEFCCTSGPKNCKPTNFSMFFKGRCPYFAYSYPFDDRYSTFTCTAGGNYRVVFCPQAIYS